MTGTSDVLLFKAPKTSTKTKASVAKDDVLIATAHQVENLTKEEAFAALKELVDATDFNDFKIGGILSVIQTSKWWQEDGFDNFKNFIETKFGLHYRKATYLIAIYNGLVAASVPWDKVKHLGWSKLKELADILTPTNVDEIVEKAEGLTVIQLHEWVKEYQKGTLLKNEMPAVDPTSLTTMTFKVHEDQKETIRTAIEKAKKDAGTDVDAVALDAICTNFLTGGTAVKQKGLAELMSLHEPEQVLEAFSKIWPSIDVKVTL